MYTTAIHLNSFKNIMADKAVWRINRGRINEYSLYHYSMQLYKQYSTCIYTHAYIYLPIQIKIYTYIHTYICTYA